MSALSKTDFLSAIQNVPVDYDVEGIGTITIRGLSLLEIQKIRAAAEDSDGVALMMNSLVYGVIDPALTLDDVEALKTGNVGVVQAIAEKIMALSGVGADQKKASGDGS